MGRICCVKSCKAFWTPITQLSFFAFPINNEEMKEKWLNAAPGYKTLSKHSSICSNHFLPQDYTTFSGKRVLNKNAVPSVFGQLHSNANENTLEPQSINDNQGCSSSPEMTMKPRMIILLKPNERFDAAIETSSRNSEGIQQQGNTAKRYSDVSVQTCPRLSGPSEREKELQYKIKLLQNRLRRREKMISNIKALVAHLKKEGKCSDSLEDKFLKKFTKFHLELFKNEANNNTAAKNSKTYTQEMREFATTLYSYSPRAYRFVRAKINLPHAATLRRWIGESGRDTKVHEILDEQVESDEIDDNLVIYNVSSASSDCGPNSPVLEDFEQTVKAEDFEQTDESQLQCLVRNAIPLE